MSHPNLEPTPHQRWRTQLQRRRAMTELEGTIATLHPAAAPAPPSDYGMTADALEDYATALAHADDPAAARQSGYPPFAVPVKWLPWELATRFGVERPSRRAAA
ncbi:hypothetical protein [Demequina rhizosphaerae]|uniref:hypothetical protein n=1 Tax=Demequina rhizosphaerae TaxID=1638985 RepID=UPI0007855A7C|nr:hypothetical protein [Demequina rhizosphaerae]